MRVLTAAALVMCLAATAEAYDIKKVERYCRSLKQPEPDTKWCVLLETSAAEMIDDYVSMGRNNGAVKFAMEQCARKGKGSLLPVRDCIAEIARKFPQGLVPPSNRATPTPESDIATLPVDVPDDIMRLCKRKVAAMNEGYSMLQACVSMEMEAKAALGQ